MRQEKMYANNNNTLDNKQDVTFLVSIIEDILKSIKNILPNITRVILKSDNAIFYQISIVPFFIDILIISTGLFVSYQIKTDTGSGKGMVDGIFLKMINIVLA